MSALSVTLMHMKNITLRLNDEDLAKFEEIKEMICAESATSVLRYCMKMVPKNHVPVSQEKSTGTPYNFNEEIEANLFNGFPYRYWKKVAEGNDPERGDWVGIKLQIKPGTSMTVFAGEDGYDYFA